MSLVLVINYCSSHCLHCALDYYTVIALISTVNNCYLVAIFILCFIVLLVCACVLRYVVTLLYLIVSLYRYGVTWVVVCPVVVVALAAASTGLTAPTRANVVIKTANLGDIIVLSPLFYIL